MLIELGVALVVLAAYVAVGTYFLLPFPPPVSWKQGKQRDSYGKVTKISRIAPGVYEAAITQEADVDPKILESGLTSIGISTTGFVHLRSWQQVPKVRDLVKATSQNRNFPLRVRSYNWVKEWRYVSEIPASHRPRLIAVPYHGIDFYKN